MLDTTNNAHTANPLTELECDCGLGPVAGMSPTLLGSFTRADCKSFRSSQCAVAFVVDEQGLCDLRLVTRFEATRLCGGMSYESMQWPLCAESVEMGECTEGSRDCRSY